jgi:two-component system phosphate regulon sensor histidine kinase PhoR
MRRFRGLPSAWYEELIYLAMLLGSLAAVGSIFNSIALFLMFGALGYLTWNLYNLYLMERWIRLGDSIDPPDANGIWETIFKSYHDLQRRQRKDKKRMAKLIKRFRATARAMPDPTIILNRELEIEWMNSIAAQTFGLDDKEDVGKRLDNFLRGPEVREWLNRRHYEQPLDHLVGVSPRRVYSLRLVPFESKGSMMLIAVDVSEARRLERFRRDFIANASHELRTPLTVFTGYLEQLEARVEREEGGIQGRWGRAIHGMQEQSLRMRQIVDDMLVLARLEEDQRKPAEVDLDVPALLRQVEEDAKILADARKQTLHVEVDLDLWLHGIEDSLRAVASNLVNNACKYTQEGGAITLRWLRNSTGQPMLQVQDNGPGIPAESVPRLTERFYRVDAGRDRAQGGSGLGLSIVKHALEQHDALLRVESKPGEGSVFSAVFPSERLRVRPALRAVAP